MSHDSIVEEIHQVREALAERFHHDLRAIAGFLRERAKNDGTSLITLPPRRVVPFECLHTEREATVSRSTESHKDPV